MRVLLVSDTHGFLDPRIEALRRGCDLVVHAGDVGSDSVLDALAADGVRLLAVRGNNDTAARWVGDQERLARALPLRHEVTLPGGVLVVVHGDRAGRPALRHQRLRREHAHARAVVYGHSHRRCVDDSDRPWVLNPGAAGRARTYGGPSCLVLLALARGWRLTEHRFEPLRARRGQGRARPGR
jgi:putative phosphoesterase